MIDIDTEEDTLELENFDTSNKELRIIKIEANYPTNQYVKEYKNYSVLSINDKTYFDKSIVNISLKIILIFFY